MAVLVRCGERLRLEISNWESAITEAPMTHWYCQKVGADTYHHEVAYPSPLRLHERPAEVTGMAPAGTGAPDRHARQRVLLMM
jgi:hypothetical protein